MSSPPSRKLRKGSQHSPEPNLSRQQPLDQSPFAIALQSVLDDTNIFDRRGWAQFLGISESAISQWVNDRTLPSPERLRTVLDFLRDTDNVPNGPILAFKAVCSATARQVTPLVGRLGDAMTFDQYMLRPLDEAFRSTLGTLPAALQEQTWLIANETARRASRSGAATVASDVVSERLQSLVSDTRKVLGADSVCFYVADPLLQGDFRLSIQSGVRYPETLQGPRFPLKSKSMVALDQDHLFVKDAQSAKALRDDEWNKSDPIEGRIIALIDRNHLFGDFVAREEVQSCARIQGLDSGQLACLLFVNYSRPQEFPNSLRQTISSLFERLRDEALPHFTSLYCAESMGDELHKLTIALQSFLAENKRNDFEALERGLKVIIRSILDVLGLAPEDTLGSIHLFEKEKYILRPAAQVTPKEIGPLPLVHAELGVGLISWAAVRRRAIMVNDLSASDFGQIYSPIREETRSNLALPMFAGGDLMGVLNIESSRTNVFSTTIVRTLSLAASQMAITWQNFMHGKYFWILERLLSAADRDLHRYLTGIANVAAQLYDESSSTCDVWRYDRVSGLFDNAGISTGASFQEIISASSPRKGGWSYYIVEQSAPVFIHRIDSLRDFIALRWNGGGWVDIGHDAPSELNDVVLKENIKAKLGFPIMSDNECRGVLWLKFGVEKAAPPPALIRALEVIGRNAGPKLVKAA